MAHPREDSATGLYALLQREGEEARMHIRAAGASAEVATNVLRRPRSYPALKKAISSTPPPPAVDEDDDEVLEACKG